MRKNRKPVFFIILIIALLMAYTAIFGVSIPLGSDKAFTIAGAPEMRYGIDIRGGVDAAFEPVGLDRKPTGKELEAARSIIETRLDQQNILDRDVTVDKDNGYIIVRFPWKADEKDFNPQEAMAELGETAQLTFQDAEGNVLVEGSHVSNSSPEMDRTTGQYAVSLTFDEEGTKLFSKATQKLIGKEIDIYMDKTLVQRATVNEHIGGGKAQIDHIGTYDEAKALSDKINAGSLPFSMTTKNHSTISPTLGAGALDVMVQAGVIAFAIICLLLILYYRLPGFVACIALLIQVSGQLLALSIPQVTLTLTGIASIILSIGMGVDANVIISERINEEIKSGKSIPSAISSGFKDAFSSVFDGNITVLIVAIILMIFGSGSLLSFAYSLLTGIFFNFVAGVTASRLMIRSLSEFKALRQPALFKCRSRRVTL
ncbi:protein translocase subunit SecD [Anaerocolumna sp. MB42-C2]|uniref:protein translocase subunit SecD n=1 Tax=Anaerocolumna sp. MB42-C2 TaxID=3070997 RepID=UPI0027E16245|nr:protein translocase subunit SecD [Anaerocolumna sp. MB42-C2]WMJ89539.1 protein translocase subunit SecD [Anaerocolumna sp. MB42-C2]